jgi:hypothetical protein
MDFRNVLVLFSAARVDYVDMILTEVLYPLIWAIDPYFSFVCVYTHEDLSGDMTNPVKDVARICETMKLDCSMIIDDLEVFCKTSGATLFHNIESFDPVKQNDTALLDMLSLDFFKPEWPITPSTSVGVESP